MLTRDARVLILDEPTATLSDVEIERIFSALRALKAEGKSIIYITHRLGEVFEICDTVSVLRNGELVGTRATAEIDREHLMEMMLGRSMGEMYPRWDSKPGEPMLTVKHLRVPPMVQDFNLVAGRGMVICLAGQVGSGAIEVLRALAGLAADATGEVSVAGKAVRLRSVAKSQAAKVQFISEDRAGEGIFLRLSVGQNLVATRLPAQPVGILGTGEVRATASRLASAVGVDLARLRSQGRRIEWRQPAEARVRPLDRRRRTGRALDERADPRRRRRRAGGNLPADPAILRPRLLPRHGVVGHRRGARHVRHHRQHVSRPAGRRPIAAVKRACTECWPTSPTRSRGMSEGATRPGDPDHHASSRRSRCFALTTPGFTSPLSINALLNAISFIGCVAVGMTFITLTGNIMSLCLGATLSASALVFLSSLSAGILPAFLLTLRSASPSQRRRACWSAISAPTRSWSASPGFRC